MLRIRQNNWTSSTSSAKEQIPNKSMTAREAKIVHDDDDVFEYCEFSLHKDQMHVTIIRRNFLNSRAFNEK